MREGCPGRFPPQGKRSGNHGRFGREDRHREAQGYKVYSASSRGFALPQGTPKEIVDILGGAIKKVVTSEEHKKKMTDMGLTLRYMGPEEYAKYWGICHSTERHSRRGQGAPFISAPLDICRYLASAYGVGEPH